MALPAVAIVVGLIAGAASWGVSAVRVQHAANEAARAAVASTPSTAIATGRAIAGSDATVTVERDGVWWTVTVDAAAPWGGSVRGRAFARAQG